MRKILPYLVILAAIFAFFWPNIVWPAVNITPSVGTNDFTDFNYPLRNFLIESLKKKEFPFWSSQISSGYPILAYGQIGGLYPLNLIAALLPLQASVNFTIITTYFLLGFFTYLFLKEMKLSSLASLFGAVNMIFCGFAVNQLMHWGILTTLAFLLGELFFLEKLIKTKRLVYLFSAALLLGLQFLGGHPQMIFYSLLFLAFYFFFNHFLFGERKILKTGILFSLFVVLGVGTGMVQTLPTLEFTLSSTRVAGLSAEAITRYNFSLKDLITFVLPYARFNPSHTLEAFHHNGWPADEKYAYVGILALILALLAVCRLVTKNLKVLSFTLVFLVALFLSFGSEIFFGFILLLPPFSFFRLPLRFLMFVDVSLVILASFGFAELEKILKEKELKPRLIQVLGGILILVAFLDLYFPGQRLHPPVSAKKWYAQPEVAKFLKENLRVGERVTNEHYYYPSVKIFLSQEELWDDPQIFINLRNLIPVFNSLLEGIEMAVGAANSGGLKIGRYNDLEMEIVFGGIKYEDFKITDFAPWYFPLNRLLGTRYLLLTSKIERPELKLVFQTNFQNGQDQVYVYELFDYYPRAFMVPKAEVLEPEEIKEHLLAGDFEPKQKVFLEEEIEWGAKGGFAASSQIKEAKDQLVRIETQASGDGFLFLSDPYYPGWKAFVDGKTTKIYRANYAFRAVPLEEGKHEVVFKYEPESFKWGAMISFLSFSLIGLGGLVTGFKKICA